MQVDNGGWVKDYLWDIGGGQQGGSWCSQCLVNPVNLKCQKKMWCVSLNCVSLYMCKWTDADRAQKHGMDEFISSNPCNFDHASLFETVQRLTLDHRLNDSYSCLASIFFDLQQLKHDIFKKSNIPLPLCQSSPCSCTKSLYQL